MLAWESYEFAGIIPRLRKKQLPRGYATIAHDVDLTHGSLKSFFEVRDIATVSPDSIRFHVWGCDVLAWDKCVSVAEWIPDCPRLFLTGYAAHPQVITKEKDGYVYRRLGVPLPDKPPTAEADWVQSDKARATAYLITFVNSFGEEGGGSLPSGEVSIEDGQRVRLAFRYAPPIEYDIKKLRIYRRETGFNTGLEKEQELSTHWFFLAELDISEREYTDTTPIVNLGWAFEGLDTREPPARLANITALPDTAILAGSVGNKVLFSRNLQPHNWELGQELTLDDNVIALGVGGGSLYVATDGYPYRIKADIGCDKRECRDVYRYKQPHPMVNCHVGAGAVSTPYGLVYASPDGLVLLSDSPAPQIITSEVLSADDWRLLAPHTARLAYHKGALFVVTDKISFILWMDGSTYQDAKYKKMVTISDTPRDMRETRQGALLFLNEGGRVAQWNAAPTRRPYRWQSAAIDTGFVFDLTRVRALLASGDSTVGVLSERAEITRRFAVGDTNIPFGRQGRQREFYLTARGTGEITELVAGVCVIDMGTKE